MDGIIDECYRYWYKDARRYANQQQLTLLGPQRVFDSTIAHVGALWAQQEDEKKFLEYTQRVFELFFKRQLELDSAEAIKYDKSDNS